MKKIILTALIASSISFPLQAELAPKDYFTAGCLLVGTISLVSTLCGKKKELERNKSNQEETKPYQNQSTLLLFGAFALTAGAYFHFATPAK